jgi:hypothetical protein
LLDLLPDDEFDGTVMTDPANTDESCLEAGE